MPAFGKRPLDAIEPSDVRLWHATTDATKPTIRAHSHALLRTIFAAAVADDLVPANPCRIVGAGATRRAGTTRPATLAGLEVLVAAMPERLRQTLLHGSPTS